METHEPTREELYGVRASTRIPGTLNAQLSREASALGISFSRHMANTLINGHANLADQVAEINILLKEKQRLQEQVTTLEAKLAVPGKAQRFVTAKLEKNYQALQSFLQQSRSKVSRQALLDAGFDFKYATSMFCQQQVQYNCVFDACYWQQGEQYCLDTIQLT